VVLWLDRTGEYRAYRLRRARRDSGPGPPRALHGPHGVMFVPELPKTATGKIQKFVLRQGAPNLARQ
jgi:non-ribosomal peptide synthetase component E (peptide arylation enzyme)